MIIQMWDDGGSGGGCCSAGGQRWTDSGTIPEDDWSGFGA